MAFELGLCILTKRWSVEELLQELNNYVVLCMYMYVLDGLYFDYSDCIQIQYLLHQMLFT